MKLRNVFLFLSIAFISIMSFAEDRFSLLERIPDKGDLGRISIMRASDAKIDSSRKSPASGRYCIKSKAVGEDEKTRHYVYYNKRFLPFTLNTGITYRLSVFARAEDGACGYMKVEIYDKNKKHIDTFSSPSTTDKDWKKIEAKFSVRVDECLAVPIFYLSGDKDATVYWDDFSASAESKPQLFYFSKKDNGLINLNCQIDAGSLGVSKASSPQLTAQISCRDALNEKTLFVKKVAIKDYILDADLDLEDCDSAVCRLIISISQNGKTLYSKKMSYVKGLDTAWKEMEGFHKETNCEVGVDIKEAESITPTPEEQENGFVIFNRPEPRWIQPDSIPSPEERLTGYRRLEAQGNVSFFTLALLPLADLDGIETEFLPDADAPKDSAAYKTGSISYSPQQTNYSYRDKIRKYWILPEILENSSPLNLRKGLVKQFFLRARIAPDAEGELSGKWQIKSGENIIADIPVKIKVLPLKPQAPADIVSGLYIDPVRWWTNPDFTDKAITAELKDVREHGYNSLFLGVAPPSCKVWFQKDKDYYKLDIKRFVEILKLCRDAGFDKQPYIINPYALERVMLKRVGQPAPKGRKYSPKLEKYVIQFFTQLRDAVVKEGYPEPLIAGIDEASHGERMDKSVRVLSAAKKVGFRTVCTTYQWCLDKNPDYEKLLDVRNYACPGFWEMRTPERAEQLRQDTLRCGDTFWSYGSGCYANANPPGPQFRNVRQDGCLSENRYQHGLFIYRAKLKGEWSWCFSRWRGSPENDFDDPQNRKGEVKEQCIVYPGIDSAKNRDTLQWEALRQGWQDYCAISTLDKILQERKDSEAHKARKEFERIVSLVPWQNYTQFPDQKLGNLREWVLQSIMYLSEKGDKK